MTELDEKFMREALREAHMAEDEDEIPIGAVITFAGRVIAKGHTMTERLHDPTTHAEMIAITAATEAMGGKYLNDCTLYVTVEPCPMCAGAIINARVDRVFYGARDSAFGACGGVTNLFMEEFPNRPALVGGILAADCQAVLTEFFDRIRRKGSCGSK